MSQKLLKRVFSAIAAFSLLVNSISAPLAVYAQEVTPEPTPIVEEATPSDTVTPTPEVTVAPTEEVTPIPTEEITPTPTDEITPTPTVEEASTPASKEQPAQTESTQEITGQPTPTPTVTTVEEEKGVVDAVILHNTSATSISEFDFEYQTEGSATLTTDKADYAPTDAVLITGTGFAPNETYTLEITSDTGNFKFSDRVTSDESGNLFYSYQLDGTYRPDYKVEIKNGDSVISSTTFTDAPTSGCTTDSAGANDEPGQKDLNKMCVDYSALPTSESISWNWDEIGWTGSNTGDACALFDTDGDGFANYSLCVRVSGTPATYQNSVLFSCTDGKADRCTGSAPISTTSTCGASIQSTDPFPGPPNSLKGDSYPNDTVGSCTAQMSDFSPSPNATLLDVCSYPSQQPNSDPSDCVLFRSRSGKLEVTKTLIPSSDTGLFNLQIDGVTKAANVGNNGDTGEQVVSEGNHTVGETAGTGTSLTNYTSAIVCKDLHGTGTTVASGANAGPLTVNVSDGSDIVCAVTNTLDQGTIVVHKDVRGPGGEDITDTSHSFSVTLDGLNAQSFTDGGAVTYNNVPSGTHTIAESVIPSGYSLYSITPDNDGAVGAQVSVVTGQTTDVYVVNRQQNATITVIKNVLDPDNGEVVDTHQFTVNVGTQSDTIGEGDNGVFTVAPGTYTITEDSDANYDFVSISPDEDAAAGVQVVVAPGERQTVNVVNKQKIAHITVNKDVVRPDGQTDVADNHTFTSQLNGANDQSFSENSPYTYDVNPGGPFAITELDDANYDEMGCSLVTGGLATGITLSSNQTIEVTCKNAQKSATITVEKDVLKYDGSQTSDANIFSVTLGGQTKDFSEVAPAVFTVDPGMYSATEAAETGYSEYTNDSPKTVGPNGSATIHIVNNQDPLSISGYKFDADGQTGLGGWTIKLYSCLENFLNCTYSTETTTDVNGLFTFAGLSTGLFKVEEVLQGGWTNLSDLFHNVTLAPVANSENNNFVNFELGKITVCKYNDINGNGGLDGEETTVNGVTMNLSVWDEENEEWVALAPQDTEGNGCTQFSGLTQGSYQVTEDVPQGYYPTSPVDPNSFEVDVNSGTDVTFNFLNSPYRTISGQKYEDVNGNGQKDSGEAGLPDWTIYIDSNFNDAFDGGEDFRITDADGNYEFTNLVSDLYRIREVTDSAWTQTQPVSGYYDADVHVDVTSTGNDFGNFENGNIGDFIWQDTNGDGAQDPGEPGIAGISVNLYLDTDGTPGLNTLTDTLVGTDTTDGTGGYLFENLGPGEYFTDVIESTLPAGFANTTPDPVGPIVLSSGETYLLADVGYVPPVKEIRIEKSNDKGGGATAGDTVTYTLVITNTGNVAINNVIVTDSLPGGFSYVTDSTSIVGAPDVEPTVSGSTLKWDIGTVATGEPVTITYQAKISSELPAGTYKNYATCEGQIGGFNDGNDGIDGPLTFLRVFEPEPINCNTDDSDVSLGQSFSYGGKLTPQVLGAATELPATGSSTGILIFAIAAGLGGFALKLREKRTKHAKN